MWLSEQENLIIPRFRFSGTLRRLDWYLPMFAAWRWKWIGIRSIWFAEQTLSLRENRLTGSHCLLHHRTLGTRHPLPPHWALVLHQVIYDYLILYTYIYCQDARDLDITVFCFLFLFFGFLIFFLVCCCILYSTSLSSYVQPDDGHHYGRNM